MTTRTPAPETDEPNTPTFSCAVESCGHKARTHAENGYGPCTAKKCSGLRRNGTEGACESFIFEADAGLGSTTEASDPSADAAEDPGSAPATEATEATEVEEPDIETVEQQPDDAAYDPKDPFDPSRHLRILTHHNRKTGETTESHYLDVKWRMTWLRSASGVAEGYLPAHPRWRIEVDSLLDWTETIERGFAIFRARLWDTDPLYEFGPELAENEALNRDPDFQRARPGSEALLVSEGHGSQSREGWADFIEKAETKAIGRCLISAGYGTASAAEFEEGETISEGGVPIAQGHDATPIPECPHGHGTGPVRRLTSRFGEYEGQEIFWCGAAPDGGQKCSWTISVAEWQEQLAADKASAERIAADDPGDPNEGATEGEQKEDAAPTPGESRTASSGSEAGPSSGSTGSRTPSSSGTQRRAPSAGSRETRPAQPAPSRPQIDSGAIPGLLTKFKITMPQVMQHWGMSAATPAEISRVMTEQEVTLETMFEQASEVPA